MSPLLPIAAMFLLGKMGKKKKRKKKKKKHKAKKHKAKKKAPTAATLPWPGPVQPPLPPLPPLPPMPVPTHDATAHQSPIVSPPAHHAATTHQASKASKPSGGSVSDITVLSAQRKLNRLGANPRLKEDELYGPKTRRAWAKAAKLRRLNPAFERIGPKVARVNAATDYALSKASGVSGGIYIP